MPEHVVFGIGLTFGYGDDQEQSQYGADDAGNHTDCCFAVLDGAGVLLVCHDGQNDGNGA